MRCMNPPTPQNTWQAQAKPLLGVKTDKEIALQLGVTARQVSYMREKLNIEPPCRARWRGDVSKRIGVTPDQVLAKELSLSISAVRRQRQARELSNERHGMPDAARHDLGRLTDAELATKYGRSYSTARRWRTDAGLAAVFVRRAWSGAELQLLGTMPDAVVGRLTKRRVDNVKRKRVALSIKEHKA